MIIIEADSGGNSDPIVVTNSTSGSTADTSVATGGYSGSSAKLIETHASVDKVGPLFVVYDPHLQALLAMNF